MSYSRVIDQTRRRAAVAPWEPQRVPLGAVVRRAVAVDERQRIRGVLDQVAADAFVVGVEPRSSLAQLVNTL